MASARTRAASRVDDGIGAFHNRCGTSLLRRLTNGPGIRIARTPVLAFKSMIARGTVRLVRGSSRLIGLTGESNSLKRKKRSATIVADGTRFLHQIMRIARRGRIHCSCGSFIRANGEQRVAIWWRTHDGLSSDIAAGARPVLNDALLTELLGEPLTYYARDDVNRLARGKSDDHAHRPRRIGLSPSEA
jgi:hypothetical protein